MRACEVGQASAAHACGTASSRRLRAPPLLQHTSTHCSLPACLPACCRMPTQRHAHASSRTPSGMQQAPRCVRGAAQSLARTARRPAAKERRWLLRAAGRLMKRLPRTKGRRRPGAGRPRDKTAPPRRQAATIQPDSHLRTPRLTTPARQQEPSPTRFASASAVACPRCGLREAIRTSQKAAGRSSRPANAATAAP